MEDIYKKDRKEWVLCWPGQIVIAGSQTYWTAGVEQGISTNTLPEFFEILLENVSIYASNTPKLIVNMVIFSWMRYGV